MKKKTTMRSRSDQSNVFAILERDHKNVKKLFKQLLGEKERNEEVFKRINQELDIHMLSEEKHLYPELENDDRTREMILESYEEHNLGKELKQQLDNDSFDDEHWIAKLKVLSDVIDHHIEEEEGRMFPRAKKVLDKNEQQRIADSILQEKQSGIAELVTEGPEEEEEEEKIEQGSAEEDISDDIDEGSGSELGDESDDIQNRRKKRLKE